MKKPISLLIVLLLSACVTAQEKSAINIRINDSSRRAFELRMEQFRIEKRNKIELFLRTAHPDSVTVLDIGGAGYKELPDLSSLTKLVKIDAGGNKLAEINKTSFVYDSLKTIILSGNNLKKVRFPKNNMVTHLTLENNKLKRIPCAVRKLKHLKTLDLSRNNIRRIPAYVARLDSLSEINLNYNQLKMNRRNLKRLAKTEVLLLAGNEIETLPENIDLLDGVKKLNLSKNRISTLPAGFKNLKGLTNIIFYENKFEEIPNEIFGLVNLVELDFYYNQITTIPDSIGRLVGLQQLFLSFNQIRSIPEPLLELTALRYFYIHHNQITNLPGWVASLEHLERLDVSYNKLFSLPDLSKSVSLKEIDIQHNDLAHFPWKLLDMKKLSILLVKDNPFILSRDEKAFLESLSNNPESGGLILVY